MENPIWFMWGRGQLLQSHSTGVLHVTADGKLPADITAAYFRPTISTVAAFLCSVWVRVDLLTIFSWNRVKAHPPGWPPWPSCHSHTSPAPHGCRLGSPQPPQLLRTEHAQRLPHECLKPQQRHDTTLFLENIYKCCSVNRGFLRKFTNFMPVMGLPWFITLPNTLIPRGVMEQFQRRFLNWCWHWIGQRVTHQVCKSFHLCHT